MTKTKTKRVVGAKEYAARKTLAVSLSGGVFVGCAGIAILLASMPYACYLDRIAEAQARIEQGRPPDYTGDLDMLYSYYGRALFFCRILIPTLMFGTLVLWLTSRKSWNTVRGLQPITQANTGDMLVADSLVRPSDYPVQDHKVELLRAGEVGNETPADELL